MNEDLEEMLDGAQEALGEIDEALADLANEIRYDERLPIDVRNEYAFRIEALVC